MLILILLWQVLFSKKPEDRLSWSSHSFVKDMPTLEPLTALDTASFEGLGIKPLLAEIEKLQEEQATRLQLSLLDGATTFDSDSSSSLSLSSDSDMSQLSSVASEKTTEKVLTDR